MSNEDIQKYNFYLKKINEYNNQLLTETDEDKIIKLKDYIYMFKINIEELKYSYRRRKILLILLDKEKALKAIIKSKELNEFYEMDKNMSYFHELFNTKERKEMVMNHLSEIRKEKIKKLLNDE